MIRHSLYILSFIFLLFSGCKKHLDIESSRLVSEENMWESLEDARAALMGVYALTKSALNDHNAHWLYGEVRTNEYQIPIRQDLKAIANNDLKVSSFKSLNDLKNWRRWYAVINSANIFLDRISEVREKDTRYTENNMVVDVAQVRFLRAFAYFYMSRIWGDVPLITSSRELSFDKQPRENQEKVLAWAEQEIRSVAELLPYRYSVNDERQIGDYYNESSGRWDGALARKLSAYAILAHIAAWQANYPDVVSYTKPIIDDFEKASMSLISTNNLTDPNGFFYDKNNNQLLGFGHVYNYMEGSFTGNIEELTLAAPVVNKSVPDIYYSKEEILNLFTEAKDERFSIDTLGNPISEKYFTNFNGAYPIFSKIKCIMGGETDPSFRFYSSATVITRLEDIYLLRAEALSVLGETREATEILNSLRERRGLDPYSQEENGDLIDAIFAERHRELMGEGHRWYDMIRYQKLTNENSPMQELIQNDGIYWPVSQEVINQNELITQNEYWK